MQSFYVEILHNFFVVGLFYFVHQVFVSAIFNSCLSGSFPFIILHPQRKKYKNYYLFGRTNINFQVC